MKTPLLLIHFNRPDLTARQIELLASVKPRKLFILCDGPRATSKTDGTRVPKVRALLETLPWDCDVQRLYRNENLGCFRNISTGITWFLDQVGEGIILEDDCFPDVSFFRYCSELLDHHRSNTSVFAVCGSNRRSSPFEFAESYALSNYFECWGWATWKRAWDHFDPNMTAWRDRKQWDALTKRVFPKLRARYYWNYMFHLIDHSKRDTWAYRNMLSIWAKAGLTLIPKRNLVANEGFTPDALHTRVFEGTAVPSHAAEFPLSHPVSTEARKDVDQWFEDHFYSRSPMQRARWVTAKFTRRLRRTIPGLGRSK